MSIAWKSSRLAAHLVLLAALCAASSSASAPVDKRFAYVASQSAGTISGFEVSPVTGAFTPVPGSPFTTNIGGVSSLALDQVHNILYAANQFGSELHNITAFRIEPVTGRLVVLPDTAVAAGGGTSAIAVDPAGRFLFAANLGSNNVSAFRIEPVSGKLVPVPGSPVAAGTFPSSVTVDPLGKFVYVCDEMSNDVYAYAINQTNGELSNVEGSPFPTGLFPVNLTVDPTDRYLYVANQGGGTLSAFLIDPTSGAITSNGTYPAAGGAPNGIAVDPSGKIVYVAGYEGVFQYSINASSSCTFNPFTCTAAGGLMLQAGPIGTGSNVAYGAWTPNAIAIDYTGTFAYATNGPYGPGNVTGFSLNPITQFAGSPTPVGDGSVAIVLTRPRLTPRYSAHPIPDSVFQPLTDISAAAINNHGDVTGTATVNSAGETLRFAFLYDFSTGVTTSDDAFGTHNTYGNGLNDSDQIVGASATSEPQGGNIILSEAFLTTAGVTTNIDGRIGGVSSAFGINNHGEVTGSMSTGTCVIVFGSCNSTSTLGSTHAFKYSGKGLIDLGTLGGSFSEGRALNTWGDISGDSTVASGAYHLFLYSRGVMHDLGTLEGNNTIPVAINNDRHIIGNAITNSGPIGFVYRDGEFHNLPSLPGGTYVQPAGLNDHGHIVGTGDVAGPSAAPTHAFLHEGSRTTDLNDLVDSALTLLTSASGVNEKGQIVAKGLNGQLYVLTPKRQ